MKGAGDANGSVDLLRGGGGGERGSLILPLCSVVVVVLEGNLGDARLRPGRVRALLGRLDPASVAYVARSAASR